ncbi:MAG: VanZ family protein [Acutalibacteraceae bacterium]|nr:VanZ family protein [Acutalibacteraceae bacterium]
MVITKKEIILRAIFTTLTLLLTAFIWLHSLASADESGQESAEVLNFLNMIIAKLHIDSNLTDYIVRKLAHFLEFTAFGASLSATFIAYKSELVRQIPNMLFLMLAVPVTDEALQYFSPGRSPQISDVLLDFSGCIAGLIFTALVFTIIKYKKERT